MGKVSLFCKHEGLSSNIQSPWENLDTAVHAYNFSTRGQSQADPRSSLTRQSILYTASERVPAQDSKAEGDRGHPI